VLEDASGEPLDRLLGVQAGVILSHYARWWWRSSRTTRGPSLARRRRA